MTECESETDRERVCVYVRKGDVFKFGSVQNWVSLEFYVCNVPLRHKDGGKKRERKR